MVTDLRTLVQSEVGRCRHSPPMKDFRMQRSWTIKLYIVQNEVGTISTFFTDEGFFIQWSCALDLQCKVSLVLNATLNMILCVTYYFELRKAISIYHMSRILLINVKLVLWTLQNINNSLATNYINTKDTCQTISDIKFHIQCSYL